MKISKTAWLILAAGIFVIAVVALVMVYHRQWQEQQQLNESLAVAEQATHAARSQLEDYETRLPELAGERTELEEELTQAESLLAESKLIFAQTVESIEYGEILFDIADHHHLVITSLTASEPRAETVAGITILSASFGLHVEGGVADILGFIDTLANDRRFAGAAIGPVSVDIPQPPAEGEEEEEGPASAAISVIVHGHRGR